MVNFFSKKQEKRIIEAIREAELHTSGEIRIHLEKELKGDVVETAAAVFHELNMDRTKERNGVLIFIVPSAHRFAIIGDKGINEKVPPDFWTDVRDMMQRNFLQGNFDQGICEAVLLTGRKLKEHFPRADDDINELPDEISYRKNDPPG